MCLVFCQRCEYAFSDNIPSQNYNKKEEKRKNWNEKKPQQQHNEQNGRLIQFRIAQQFSKLARMYAFECVWIKNVVHDVSKKKFELENKGKELK